VGQLGILVALWGAYLAVSPPQVQVGLARDGSSVRLGGQVLPQHGVGVYGGGLLPALVISRPGHAAGSSALNGVHATGICDLVQNAAGQTFDEHCDFQVGDERFSSQDHLDAHKGAVWHRVYSDGKQVDIAVPTDGALVPMPFPLGR
jgi:hypothetical protein